MHMGLGLCMHLGLFALVGMASPVGLWPPFAMDTVEQSRLFQRLSRACQSRLSATPAWESRGLATGNLVRAMVMGLAGLTVGWNLANLPGR